MPIEKKASKIGRDPPLYEDNQDPRVKYKWFEAILYPQDNEQNHHYEVLRYIQNSSILYPTFIGILHDKDDKKEHYHIAFQVRQKMTVEGVSGQLCDYVTPYVLLNGIGNIYGYTKYLIHDTLKAHDDGKYKYAVNELFGDKKLIGLLQNGNFVQKGIEDKIKEHGYLLDVVENCNEYEKAEIMEHTYYYSILSNQQINRKKTGPYKQNYTNKVIYIDTENGEVDSIL